MSLSCLILEIGVDVLWKCHCGSKHKLIDLCHRFDCTVFLVVLVVMELGSVVVDSISTTVERRRCESVDGR